MATERELEQIDTIFIHCADTPNGRRDNADDIDAWHEGRFSRKSAIREKHVNQRLNIGYHFVIPVDGSIELGRHIKEIGAHAKGHNTRSVGICLVGLDRFSAEQWYSVKLLVKALVIEIPSIVHVRGHREISPLKTCPGFSVSDWLNNGMQPMDTHLFKEPSDG